MRKEGNNSIFRIIVSAFFGVFFLELLLSIFFIMGPWNRNIVDKQMIKSDFINTSVDKFSERFQEILKENGMLNTFAWELVDTTALYTAFQSDRQEQTAEFQEALEKEWDTYLEQEGIEKTENVELLKNKFIKESMRAYRQYIKPVFLNKYKEVCQKELKNFQILFIVSSICCIISLICLLKSEKYIHRSLRTVTMAVGSAGICFDGCFAFLWTKMKNFISVCEPEFYRNMLEACGQQYETVALLINVVLIVIIISLLVLVKKLKEQQ